MTGRQTIHGQAVRRACDEAFPPPEDLEGEPLKQWHRDHRWSPNQLRHNAATYLRKTYGPEAARVLLGHNRISTTEQYAEQDMSSAAVPPARPNGAYRVTSRPKPQGSTPCRVLTFSLADPIDNRSTTRSERSS